MEFALGATGAKTSERVPFMLTDDDLLHDPGDIHDPFARECGTLETLSRALECYADARSDAVFEDALSIEADVKRPSKMRQRRFWNVERSCVAAECAETTDRKTRNDARYPLCERHKRTPAVTCANGDVVCFCFYCYRAHGTDAFTTNTHTCDVQYYKRKRRLEERRKFC